MGKKTKILIGVIFIFACFSLLLSYTKKESTILYHSKAEVDFLKSFETFQQNKEYEKLYQTLVYTNGSSPDLIKDFRSYFMSFVMSENISLEIKKIPANRNLNNINAAGFSLTLHPTHYLTIFILDNNNHKTAKGEFILGVQNNSLNISILKKNERT